MTPVIRLLIVMELSMHACTLHCGRKDRERKFRGADVQERVSYRHDWPEASNIQVASWHLCKCFACRGRTIPQHLSCCMWFCTKHKVLKLPRCLIPC